MNENKKIDEKIFEFAMQQAMDMYAKDINDREPVCDMTEEEIKIMHEQKERIYKNLKLPKKKHYSSKKIMILAACMAVIIALGATVSAFRVPLFKIYVDMQGTDLSFRAQSNLDEISEGIKEFEKKSELVVPGWLPPELELNTLRENDSSVYIEYRSGDKYFSIRTEHIPFTRSGGIVTENNNYSIDDCRVMGVDGKILHMTTEIGLKVTTVFWCSDELEYTINTNYSDIMLESILADLKFFEDF